MVFGPLEITNGIFSNIIIVIYALVGLRIALRYRELKDITYLLVGCTWILLAEPWYGSAISFIVALFNNGEGISFETYFLVAITLLPITSIIWIAAFSKLLYGEIKKKLFGFFFIFEAVFEIVFLYIFFTNSSQLGELVTPVNADYSSLVLIYILISLIIVFVTGMLIARASLKSNNPEHILRGKLLLIAFLLYVGGAFLDSSVDFTAVTILIPRLIILASAFCFYASFVLPKWIKKLFLKT